MLPGMSEEYIWPSKVPVLAREEGRVVPVQLALGETPQGRLGLTA